MCWELHVIDRHSQHTWRSSTTGIIAKKLGEDRCSKFLSTLWIFDSTCAYLFSSYHAGLLQKEKVTLEKKGGKNYNLTLMLLGRISSGWMFSSTAE